jgi:hypothetical protein
MNPLSNNMDKGTVSHSSPDSFHGLIPVLLSDKPSITEANAESLNTAADILSFAQSKGSTIEHLPIPIFRSTSLGKPRLLDNSDLITGYQPIFGDLAGLKKAIPDIKDQIANIRKIVSKDPIWSSMEEEDLKKVTIQRCKAPGYYLQPPFAEDIVGFDHYSPEFMDNLDRVIDLVALGAPKIGDVSWEDAVSSVIDRTESNVGMPTMLSGDGTTVKGRLLTMRALPPPTGDPDSYFAQLNQLGTDSFGFASGMMVSPVISTRFGPTAKPVKLWTGEPGSFQVTYESVGYYPRVRLVYGVPYHVNFALARLYYQLKAGVYSLLGCSPTVEGLNETILALQKQGKIVYTFDFSAMDQHYHNLLVAHMATRFAKKGLDPWGARFLELCMLHGGIIFPGFTMPRSITYFSQFYGWVSGSQLTAIMNTIYNIAVNMTCIQQQNLSFRNDYFKRKKYLAALGDDGQFTDNFEYDIDKYTSDALLHAGATLKLQHDTIFLKKILPTGYGIDKVSKPASRIIQQTFFNEDSYIDREKWPEVMILGLMARCDSIQNHKFFKQIWPELSELILTHSRFTDAMPEVQRKDFRKGEFYITRTQKARIIDFGKQNENWLATLASRADVQPSAKEFLTLLQASGVQTDAMEAENAKMRIMYLHAWFSRPTMADYDALVKATRWIS